MLDKKKINDIYKQIQNQVSRMIPEKWEKIYLYASVIEQVNNLETGEMFFYYFPVGLLKKKPVNVYEIPNKFNIEEESYMILVDKLYKTIQELRKEFIKENEKLWSNLTISIEKMKFTVEYNYDDLLGSKYSSYDRHIIWQYKYLQYSMERLTKKDQNMLRQYLEEEEKEKEKENSKQEKTVHTENLYSNIIHNDVKYQDGTKKQTTQNFDIKNTKKYEIKDKYEIYKIMQKENQKNKVKTNEQYIQYNQNIEKQRQRIIKIEEENKKIKQKQQVQTQQIKTEQIQNNKKEQVDENKNQILNFMN